MVLKKIETNNSFTCHTAPGRNLLRTKRIVSSPISTILFVDMSCGLKMRLVGHYQPRNENVSGAAGNHLPSLTVSDGRIFVTPVAVEFCMDEVSGD